MAKILVVDDEPNVRSLIVEILVQEGHEIFAAPDAHTGLELYATHRPRLVITDLSLSRGGHGLEIIRRLRPESGVTIIAISGSGQLGLDEAKKLGVDITIAKPFSLGALIAAVRQVLEGEV